MLHKNKDGNTNGSKGYTLLFAVLVSALVLGVGVSILNIARKELLLNSSARESQYSFYSADTGYECAIYWDEQGYFATTTYGTPESIQCGTSDALGTIASSTIYVGGGSYPDGLNTAYPFYFDIPIAGTGCAHVTVTKEYELIPSVSAYGMVTTVDSRGYNVGWNPAVGKLDCSSVNPSKVERALYATY